MSQSTPLDSDSNESEVALRESGSKFRLAMRALRHRNYRLFFGGQLVSLIGTWMQNVAQSWLVYRLTGSSFLLGSIGFASQMPIFLLAFVGGAVADRYNRHRIIITAQAASMVLALVLALLTLTDTVRIWHIFVLSVLLGIVNAFDMPARQAFVVQLVRKEDLMNAIALNSSVFNGARVLGPAVAGLLIAAIGEGWCFFANGVSYVAVLACLLLMKLAPQETVARTRSALSDVLEGLDFVRQAQPIRAALLLVGLVSLFGMSYSVLMPIFADKILHGGPRGLGILMGSTGLGALTGSFFLASRPGTLGLGKMIASACAGFACSLILFSLSRYFWLSALFLAPVGFSLMVLMACANTMIQLVVPDHLRGRVMATHVWVFMGMAPFGSLLAGSIAEHLGVSATILMGGLFCLAGAGLFAYRSPSFPQASK